MRSCLHLIQRPDSSSICNIWRTFPALIFAFYSLCGFLFQWQQDKKRDKTVGISLCRCSSVLDSDCHLRFPLFESTKTHHWGICYVFISCSSVFHSDSAEISMSYLYCSQKNEWLTHKWFGDTQTGGLCWWPDLFSVVSRFVQAIDSGLLHHET